MRAASAATLVLAGLLLGGPGCKPPDPPRPNVLLITLDDMGWDSVGAYGSELPDVTPNIDRLASEGLAFEHAHVSVSLCQPSRAALMTGLHPHRSGALGFEPIREGVPTLFERMKAGGYRVGIMSKLEHTVPSRSQAWDVSVPATRLNGGRDPAAYHDYARAFFGEARQAGKPFLLVANIDDPHFPFAGSVEESRFARERRFGMSATPPAPGRFYAPADVPVPGYLPDLPEIRVALAAYYGSVHRADESVGAILRALDEEELRDSTLVVLLSDNGMPFPFAKTNVYASSTRTPMIVRWPGVVLPGVRDTAQVVSAVDLAPTLLAASGLAPLELADGRSLLPLLRGEPLPDRDLAFTFVNETVDQHRIPMRAAVGTRYGYVYNAWSDGTTTFSSRLEGGPVMGSMRAAAERDPRLAARLELLDHRVPEELYDYAADPAALLNLVDAPEAATVLARMRARLRAEMQATGDPLLERFEARLRDRPASVEPE